MNNLWWKTTFRITITFLIASYSQFRETVLKFTKWERGESVNKSEQAQILFCFPYDLNFEMCEMDTDNAYMSISTDSIEVIVKPHKNYKKQ